MNRKCWVLISMLLAWEVALADHQSGAKLWIDVRTPGEFETGHLPGAHNINFDRIAEHIESLASSKNTPIFLYCKSGRRSGFAKQILEDNGYTGVVNAGGLGDVLRRQGAEPATGPH